MATRLFLSFWDVCLDNLPQGRFDHRSVSAPEAAALIQAARADKTLICVSHHDLLAPYQAKQRQRHEALCATLVSVYGIGLKFEDYTSSFEDKERCIQTINPLQGARLAPDNRLLVVSCAYRWTPGENDFDNSATLDEETVTFNLIQALGAGEGPWEKNTGGVNDGAES